MPGLGLKVWGQNRPQTKPDPSPVPSMDRASAPVASFAWCFAKLKKDRVWTWSAGALFTSRLRFFFRWVVKTNLTIVGGATFLFIWFICWPRKIVVDGSRRFHLPESLSRFHTVMNPSEAHQPISTTPQKPLTFFWFEHIQSQVSSQVILMIFMTWAGSLGPLRDRGDLTESWVSLLKKWAYLSLVNDYKIL